MSTTAPALAAPGKYLSVAVAGNAYGIPVRKVREIIRLQTITPIPRLPEWMKGVINLRGTVVPIIDLRGKLGFRALDGERTCIVVVQITAKSGAALGIGLIVDSVDEVSNVAAEDIEPPPEFGVGVDVSAVLGMAKVHDTVRTLLDIDRVITEEIVAQVHDDSLRL